MTGVFADLEAATASAAMAAVSNCTATIGAYSGVPGIFDAAYAEMMGISGVSPSLLIIAAHAPTVSQGDSVTLDSGGSYTVTRVEPDGTGMVRLALESA